MVDIDVVFVDDDITVVAPTNAENKLDPFDKNG